MPHSLEGFATLATGRGPQLRCWALSFPDRVHPGSPASRFSFRWHSAEVGEATHTWFGRKIVTMFDDHDKVGREKRRYCNDPDNQGDFRSLVPALALNLTTLGIPCIYYGSEQAFDGGGDSDRYLRECMFGGPFGSFQSTGSHFFREDHPVYRKLAEIVAVQRSRPELRRGRQYLRPISASGQDGSFGDPVMIGGQIRSLVPWSRILNDHELLLAINTDLQNPRSAWVTIDASLHASGDQLRCVYTTHPGGTSATLQVEARNGRAAFLTLPASGFAIFE